MSALPSFPNTASNDGFFTAAGSFSVKISVIASLSLNGSCSSTVTNLMAAFFPLPTNFPLTVGFAGEFARVGTWPAAKSAKRSSVPKPMHIGPAWRERRIVMRAARSVRVFRRKTTESDERNHPRQEDDDQRQVIPLHRKQTAHAENDANPEEGGHDFKKLHKPTLSLRRAPVQALLSTPPRTSSKLKARSHTDESLVRVSWLPDSSPSLSEK